MLLTFQSLSVLRGKERDTYFAELLWELNETRNRVNVYE